MDSEHVFKFLIESPTTCWKVVSSYQMVFHYFRFFYFMCFFGVGLFCSLYGMKNMMVSCQIIGFVSGFCVVFTVISIVFFSSSIKRDGGIDDLVNYRLIGTDWIFYSADSQAFGKSTQLYFQWIKK